MNYIQASKVIIMVSLLMAFEFVDASTGRNYTKKHNLEY